MFKNIWPFFFFFFLMDGIDLVFQLLSGLHISFNFDFNCLS
jgi:hypothetical protein